MTKALRLRGAFFFAVYGRRRCQIGRKMKLIKKGEIAGQSGEQEKRHKKTNEKKATTTETESEHNISRQNKSDCGKDAQKSGR